MSTPNHNRILANASRALLEQEDWLEPFEVNTYPSSMPFCQVQYLFSKLDPIEEYAGDTFMDKIFLEIGTVVHEVVQTYLGKAKILYGKWQCRKCGWISKPFLGIPRCGQSELQGNPESTVEPCGNGQARQYVEFRVKDVEAEASGKIDGLILVAGRLYILEIKTKPSVEKVSAMQAADELHIAQAGTYAELSTPAEWGIDLPIEGVAFCYVPRDYPNKMKFIFHKKDASALENQRRELPEAKKMLADGTGIENARGICKDILYAERVKYCPYAMQCFRPDRGKYLKSLWEKNKQLERVDASDQ